MEKQKFTLVDLIRGIRRKTVDLLGLDLMSDQFATLALNYIFIMVYYTLETVFVNTLLYRVTGSMYSVLIYRGITYGFCALGMNICSAFIRRITPLIAVKTGGICYILVYAIMFLRMDELAVYMYIVAAFSGLAQGFYWSGHNVLITLYTTPRNRAVGIGITGIIQGIMTLLTPLVSGFVIQLLPGMTGYRVMFGIAIATILVHFFFMNKLKPVERKHRPRDYKFALKLVIRKLSLRLMLCFEFVRGIRDGALSFFLNMVLFEIVTNESLVGFNSFLTGVFSITAAWVFGRIATPQRRVRLVLAATCGLMAFCSLLLLQMSAATVILFSVVNTFLVYFLNNVATNYAFDLMGQNDTTRGVMTELMGFREVAVDGGRIAGLVVVTLFPDTSQGYVYAMLTLTAIQFITVGLLAYSKRIQERKRHRKKEVRE